MTLVSLSELLCIISTVFPLRAKQHYITERCTTNYFLIPCQQNFALFPVQSNFAHGFQEYHFTSLFVSIHFHLSQVNTKRWHRVSIHLTLGVTSRTVSRVVKVLYHPTSKLYKFQLSHVLVSIRWLLANLMGVQWYFTAV